MRPWLPMLLGGALLAGCAGLRSVSCDVSTFGDWPAARAPGTYAFERLPSQQAQAAEAERIETTARGAIEKAGFRPIAAGEEPEVLVQVAARTTRTDPRYWDDMLWWRGGFGYWRGRPWYGPGWGLSANWDVPRYEREVAVLIRDRASGKPLWEARASNDGFSGTDATLLAAMFQAALMDFPRPGVNPRRIVVALPD